MMKLYFTRVEGSERVDAYLMKRHKYLYEITPNIYIYSERHISTGLKAMKRLLRTIQQDATKANVILTCKIPASWLPEDVKTHVLAKALYNRGFARTSFGDAKLYAWQPLNFEEKQNVKD